MVAPGLGWVVAPGGSTEGVGAWGPGAAVPLGVVGAVVGSGVTLGD